MNGINYGTQPLTDMITSRKDLHASADILDEEGLK